MWYALSMESTEPIKAVSDVIIDSYFIIDRERTILDFNQTFYAMLPRSVGRGLKGKKCYDVLNLDICQERCVAKQCWEAKRQVRLDEINGHVATTDRTLTFILSAMPLTGEDGELDSALVVHRNVTDEAQVQQKYQEMLENEKRERERLMYIIRSRTKDLLDTSQQLLTVQKELMEFRRGRII
jgi:PAS domain-containing protein